MNGIKQSKDLPIGFLARNPVHVLERYGIWWQINFVSDLKCMIRKININESNYNIIMTSFLDEGKNAKLTEIRKSMPKDKNSKANKNNPASKSIELFVKMKETRMTHCKMDKTGM